MAICGMCGGEFWGLFPSRKRTAFPWRGKLVAVVIDIGVRNVGVAGDGVEPIGVCFKCAMEVAEVAITGIEP